MNARHPPAVVSAARKLFIARKFQRQPIHNPEYTKLRGWLTGWMVRARLKGMNCLKGRNRRLIFGLQILLFGEFLIFEIDEDSFFRRHLIFDKDDSFIWRIFLGLKVQQWFFVKRENLWKSILILNYLLQFFFNISFNFCFLENFQFLNLINMFFCRR